MSIVYHSREMFQKTIECVQEYTEEEAAIIEREFTRLKGKHYMDHAGATLYAESQIQAVRDLLASHLFCNPHTSRITEHLMNEVRQRVLAFFNTDSSEYSLIFTSGATGSLKLVAENFVFRPDSGSKRDEGAFVYLRDNHTSVLGMRAIVDTDRIDPLQREDFLRHLKLSARSSHRKPSLLVFPAQNNFNAFKYPLELIEEIQVNGLMDYKDERFYVCLDAASYVSTNFLDLSRYQPDFVCLSFYKIFGYPTGLGALLVRKGSEDALEKKYYGGGTIKNLLSGQNLHQKHDNLVQRFEDGTQPFLSIISLLEGMNTIQRLIVPKNGYRSMDRISRHVFNLAKYSYQKLATLKHANGKNVILFYMNSKYETRDHQGGIVNFNVLRDDGSYIGFAEFAEVAAKHEVYVRTGCFCNAGTCQRQLGLSDEDVLMFFRMGKICGDDIDMIEGQPTGTVRASFGYMNRPEDVDRLVEMILEQFVASKLIRNEAMANPVDQKLKSGDLTLKAIYIYPIRSCGAVRITGSWPLIGDGRLKHDRDFTIIDSSGKPLQRSKHPEITAIVPKIHPSLKSLALSHPSMINDLIVPLYNLLERSDLQQTNVNVADCGEEAAAWLSRALRIPGLRLLRQLGPHPKTTPNKLLMINWDTLGSLVDNADDAVYAMTRSWMVEQFQGNLVVQGHFQQDMQSWKEVSIGGTHFEVSGTCSRIPMIPMDHKKGTIPADSLKAIANLFTKKEPLGMYLTGLEDGSTSKPLECGAKIQSVTQNSPRSSVIVTEYVSRDHFHTNNFVLTSNG